jgi:hypothetical protein
MTIEPEILAEALEVVGDALRNLAGGVRKAS